MSSIAELLAEFPDHYFNIDAKSDEVVGPLLSVVDDANALDRVCFGSFSDKRLKNIQQLSGDAVCTSLGPKSLAVQILRGYGIRLFSVSGTGAQVPPSYKQFSILTKRFVNQAHADGMFVHAWTIDDAAEIHRLLDLGVDGIMTDRPSVLKEVFESRGLAL